MWSPCDPQDGDEPLFGDRLPKTQAEAENCTRAAEIGYNTALRDFEKDLADCAQKLRIISYRNR